MKNALRLLLGFCLASLTLPALAQTPSPDQPTPVETASAVQGDLGFGYAIGTGSPALAVDTSAVFIPGTATLVVDPGDTAAVQSQLNATDNDNGTWTLPDPETSTYVTARVQYAASAYADDVTVKPVGSSLPVVSKAAISIVPGLWFQGYRIRRGYACGQQGSCPGGCNNGYAYTSLKKFLLCAYTGRPWDYCLDSLQPVCLLRQYKCLDCTGGVINQWLNYQYVCATF